MIDKAAFQAGLLELATTFNVQLTPERIRIYGDVMSPKLSTAQWRQAVRRAIESESFFPPPAALLRYGQAGGSLAAKAGIALERILDHFEGGEKLGYRDVERLYGRAAAEAFMAVGGARRFEWCEPNDEPFRLRDFKAAFLEVAEVDPIGALEGGSNAEIEEGADTGHGAEGLPGAGRTERRATSDFARVGLGEPAGGSDVPERRGAEPDPVRRGPNELLRAFGGPRPGGVREAAGVAEAIASADPYVAEVWDRIKGDLAHVLPPTVVKNLIEPLVPLRIVDRELVLGALPAALPALDHLKRNYRAQVAKVLPGDIESLRLLDVTAR